MLRCVMSCPSNSICPPVGMRTPAISLAMVDLPPPLGPVMTTNRPSGTEKLTSLSMSTWPASSSTSKRMFLSSSIVQCSF